MKPIYGTLRSPDGAAFVRGYECSPGRWRVAVGTVVMEFAAKDARAASSIMRGLGAETARHAVNVWETLPLSAGIGAGNTAGSERPKKQRSPKPAHSV